MQKILVHDILLFECSDLVDQVHAIFKNPKGRILITLLGEIQYLYGLVSYLDEVYEYLISAHFVTFLVVVDDVGVDLLELLDDKLGLLGVLKLEGAIEEWEVEVSVLKHHRVAHLLGSFPGRGALLFQGQLSRHV